MPPINTINSDKSLLSEPQLPSIYTGVSALASFLPKKSQG